MKITEKLIHCIVFIFLEIIIYNYIHPKFTMSKRNNDEGGSEEPPLKKVQFEPVRLGPISTMEDLDMKVLQYQNKKLAQV